jgi:uncharacterized HAD superfamily protein
MITTTTAANNPYWEKAVRLFLHNAEAIIANPSILSPQYNEWMNEEAEILQAEDIQKEKDRQELEQWAEDNAILIESSHPSWNDPDWLPNWKRK